MNQHPDRHSIRRIVLPSGRAIEVVRFYLEKSADRALHICPNCSSNLVQPVRWREAARGLWGLTLRCPNCDWITDGMFDQEQVDLLEEHLDDGLAEMLNDLRCLTQANMAEEIGRFAAALQADLILPEDF
jgi:hypothetical protein